MSKKEIKLKIDQEFKNLIPPPAPDELEGLKKSLLAEGCRDSLVVWKGQDIILDGHNRYAICNANGIPFNTAEREFPDRDAAKIWVIENQLGRRNLEAYARTALVLRREELVEGIRKDAKANLKTSTGGSNPRPLGRGPKAETVHTDKKLAEAASVSPKTVQRVRRVEENATQAVKDLAFSGEISTREAYDLSRLSEDEQIDIAISNALERKEKIKTARERLKPKKEIKVEGPESGQGDDSINLDLDAVSDVDIADQFATMAIVQLGRILDSFPGKQKALERVIMYCKNRL